MSLETGDTETVNFGEAEESTDTEGQQSSISNAFVEFAKGFSKVSLRYASSVASSSKSTRQLFLAAKKVYAENRQQRIDKALDIVSSAHNYDMAFLVDCTGSMKQYIDDVKTKIIEMVRLAKKHNHGINFRMAFVGYRDFDDSTDKRFQIINFCSDYSTFQLKVNGITHQQHYPNGGDYCEDVIGGMEQISKLDWSTTRSTKIVHHFADAPSHGRKYHNCVSKADKYLDLDPPFGATFKLWYDKRIRYQFYKITEGTDKMIEQFKLIVEEHPDIDDYKIRQIEVGDATDCVKLVESSISVGLGATITTGIEQINAEWETVQISTFVDSRSTSTEIEQPVSQFRNSNSFFAAKKTQCRIYKTQNITTRRTLKHAIRTDGMEESSKWIFELSGGFNCYKIRMGDELGRGKCRSALKATLETIPSAESKEIIFVDIVLKRFLKEGPLAAEAQVDLDKRRYTHQAVQNNIANFLATEFNKRVMKLRKSDNRTIRFVKAAVLVLATDQKQVWNSEELLKEFRRFTTNSGTIASDHDCTLLLEFSKWTYDFTSGYCMVTDLQGMYDGVKEEYVLTDPVIMAKNVTLFGHTNLGQRGMDLCYAACENYLDFGNPPAPSPVPVVMYARQVFKRPHEEDPVVTAKRSTGPVEE